MSESFGPPDPDLDQGDFLLNVPWGLIEAPLTICRPESAKPKGRATYGPEQETKNSFKSGRYEIIHAWGGLQRGVVLWHGCQIDKFKGKKDPSKAFAGIAPVFVLEERVPNPTDRTAIVAGNHRSFFPLPPFQIGDVTVPETFVDLRYIWSVRQSLLLAEGQRFASMGTELRMAMCEHLFTFFTRARFTDSVPCPNCQHEIPLGALVGLANEED
jgi:hypothetical protein